MIRILIADDHAIVREGLKQIIGETSDMVIAGEASNGHEVLNKVFKIDYDVVVLDITMPGINGLDVLKQIKAQRPKLPILVLRVRAKITSHFGISSLGHFRQVLKSKNLEIVHYYCAFCFLNSTKPNLNLSAKNVKLFLREP